MATTLLRRPRNTVKSPCGAVFRGRLVCLPDGVFADLDNATTRLQALRNRIKTTYSHLRPKHGTVTTEQLKAALAVADDAPRRGYGPNPAGLAWPFKANDALVLTLRKKCPAKPALCPTPTLPQASPGYCGVTPLARWNIHVALTATGHVALHRYMFPAHERAYIVPDMGGTWAQSPPPGARMPRRRRCRGARESVTVG